MTFTTSLFVGLSAHLTTSGLTTSSGLIRFDSLPEAPSDAIALHIYPLGGSPTAMTEVGLQVIVRCAGEDPRPTNNLADKILDDLDARTGLTLSSGHRITRAAHRTTFRDIDGNGRHVRRDTYHLRVRRDSANRY